MRVKNICFRKKEEERYRYQTFVAIKRRILVGAMKEKKDDDLVERTVRTARPRGDAFWWLYRWMYRWMCRCFERDQWTSSITLNPLDAQPSIAKPECFVSTTKIDIHFRIVLFSWRDINSIATVSIARR